MKTVKTTAKAVPVGETVTLGSVFKFQNSYYILSQVGAFTALLINLNSGNRWDDQLITVNKNATVDFSAVEAVAVPHEVQFIPDSQVSLVVECAG